MSSDIAENDVCIPNISPAERRKRLMSGIVSLGITLVVLTILLALGASRWWRVALLPFIMVATAGFFQWYDKT